MTSKFSSTSVETTLQTPITTAGAASMTVATGTGTATAATATTTTGTQCAPKPVCTLTPARYPVCTTPVSF